MWARPGSCTRHPCAFEHRRLLPRVGRGPARRGRTRGCRRSRPPTPRPDEGEVGGSWRSSPGRSRLRRSEVGVREPGEQLHVVRIVVPRYVTYDDWVRRAPAIAPSATPPRNRGARSRRGTRPTACPKVARNRYARARGRTPCHAPPPPVGARSRSRPHRHSTILGAVCPVSPLGPRWLAPASAWY